MDKYKFGVNYNFNNQNLYNGFSSSVNLTYPQLLLLDNSDFLLLDATNFLLLSTNFLPTSYSSTILWLESSDPLANGSIPTNNSLLSSWLDKSKSAVRFTQNSNINKPQNKNNFINGNNAIYFGNNSTSYMLSDQSVTLGSSNSVSMVFQAPTSTDHWVFDCLTSPELYVRFVVPGYVQVGFNIASTDVGMIAAQVTPGQTYVMTYIFNASNSTASIYLNGSFQTGITFSSTSGASTTRLQIGANSSLSQTFDGYVGSIILANEAWSNLKRSQMESYLGSKFGVVITN